MNFLLMSHVCHSILCIVLQMTKTTNILKRLCLVYMLPRGCAYPTSRRPIETSRKPFGTSRGKRHLHIASPCLGLSPKLTQEDVRYNGVRITLRPEENWSNDVFEQEILSMDTFTITESEMGLTTTANLLGCMSLQVIFHICNDDF